jgi:hypothetical protein
MAINYHSFEQQVATELSQRHELHRRLGRVERLLNRNDPEPQWVLRHHEDEPIGPREVRKRDNLDYLLDGLSAMYIGGAASARHLDEQQLGAERVLDVLANEDVARYFEKHYPIAVPVLLRSDLENDLPKGWRRRIQAERALPQWQDAYLRFLDLDAALASEGSPFVDFMTLLDEISVRGLWLSDLRRALNDMDELKSWVKSKTGRSLLEGFQDFFEFSESLDDLLQDLNELPLHRGMVWMHFGYWYGGGGRRMRKAAKWLVDALRKLPNIDRSADTEALKALMARLTDPAFYASGTILLAEDSLRRWRQHAIQG